MLLTCITQLFEITGFLRLRYAQPVEPRPVRVPGGAAGEGVSPAAFNRDPAYFLAGVNF